MLSLTHCRVHTQPGCTTGPQKMTGRPVIQPASTLLLALAKVAMPRGCTKLAFLLFGVFCSAAFGYNPRPNPESVVEEAAARFTVLTERLVRMEWGERNDAATFAFVNRYLPTPNYSVSKDEDWLVIKTPFLQVS